MMDSRRSVAHLNGDTLLLGSAARHLGDAAALVADRTAASGYYDYDSERWGAAKTLAARIQGSA
jgi:hypothetical protein